MFMGMAVAWLVEDIRWYNSTTNHQRHPQAHCKCRHCVLARGDI